MNRATIDALNRVNRRFYERRAGEFSATRGSPWLGWVRIAEVFAERLESAPAAARTPLVVDAGCGNGRFGALLADRSSARFRYLGLDSSLPLLMEARVRLAAARSGCAGADFIDGPPPLASGSAVLVAAFGLFHHVPGSETRRRLASDLASLVAPGGLFCLSFWQFADRARFRDRSLSWERLAEQESPGLDPGELEDGDHLLAWGDGSSARYCHHTGPSEAAAIVAASGLEILDSYRADGARGDSNLYYILSNDR